jgi:hypothetical protein
MKIILLTLVLILAVTSAGAQTNGSYKPETPTVAFCEMVRRPDLYFGKVVRFRALYTSMFEVSAFSSPECKGDDSTAWVEFEDDSIESFSNAEAYKTFRKMMAHYLDDGWVIFDTELLVTGVLDNTRAGGDHLRRYRFLITVKTIEEVGATADIDLEKIN